MTKLAFYMIHLLGVKFFFRTLCKLCFTQLIAFIYLYTFFISVTTRSHSVEDQNISWAPCITCYIKFRSVHLLQTDLSRLTHLIYSSNIKQYFSVLEFYMTNYISTLFTLYKIWDEIPSCTDRAFLTILYNILPYLDSI